ncbi:Enoyl-CoA hydratase/isomerase [Anaerovirgula multivorans]|uniref:3-hydroxyisobutyryl-CoA hydrolase n=2 Tax=Anaerovirgula multivorans TaxID=312168 RepID=A0A239KPC2_9FIRM|nr:Enoyl-CoA hydratase/isomerase [Anaerovirgula multivorans]
MIETLYEILQEWEKDDQVTFICLEGEGQRAFCAGGDVRALYDLRNSNVEEHAHYFFETEYRMNRMMFTYPKPILVYMNGVVMGGGVGISVGASHRIVTEGTKWAMPEMNIGLYPDVGGSYFLNKMPGEIGRYLALISKTITASDVLYIGAADYYLNSDLWDNLKGVIMQNKWLGTTVKEELHQLILKFNQSMENTSTLATLETTINKHFGFNSMEEIFNSLEKSAEEGDSWAKKTKEILLTKSPTSLKVTLRQLMEGKTKSLVDCFKMELDLSMNFMKSHDFFEGVRAVLVDKDQSPNWHPDTIEKVEEKDVESFFKYQWKDGRNPLEEINKTL